MAAQRPPGFRGRTGEREMLDRMLENVRGGQSAVLVIRGEAGIGKTALLRYAAKQSAGCRVAQVAGVEAEMELPFAGLHQLCAPMLGEVNALPEPQQNALRVAFGLSSGDTPDRFLVALAALGLLAQVAEQRPLLCFVDDAQWLDGASLQVLGFVARRLLAESVAIVFAVREPSEDGLLVSLPNLLLTGLDDDDARALLAKVIPGRLDERVRDRIIAETHGNPLALRELPRGLSAAELAGGFGLPDVPALSGRIEDSFLRRLQPLPQKTRLLLLIAAADPVGDPALLWRAAEILGVASALFEPAEQEGLLDIGARVRFPHPLVRSAVYRSASFGDRQRVHGALAAATDPQLDPDRRAWHRAQATPEPDEDVAEELERSADRAQSRGGVAAAAAFLERSAALTLEPARHAQRALAAAQAKHLAGAPDAALELLTAAETGPLDELQRARVDLLRGQVAFVWGRGRDAPPLLLKAAERLQPIDVGLARETYRDAFAAASAAGRLAQGAGLLEVAQAIRTAPSSQPPGASDLLLDGLALLGTDGFTAGAPMLQRALSAFRSDLSRDAVSLPWLWLACRGAHDLWDFESWQAIGTRHIQLVRDAGALSLLPAALSMRVGPHLFAGEFAAAAALVEELEAVGQAMGRERSPYAGLSLAAWQGQEAEVSRLIEATTRTATLRGEGQWLSAVHWTSAVLYNGLGRYEEALTSAESAGEYPQERAMCQWALPELIEAAARCGQPERATSALQRLVDSTRAGASDWGLAVEAQSRALLSKAADAEPLYREAIDRLDRAGVGASLARGKLLYGEWLCRENRRLEAREQLRAAHDTLASAGMDAFADRARRELLATGEKVRKRGVETRDDLTAQELQIAHLARGGLSNPEIGARLFISPRTVEWHLRKVFPKLGISSRRGLHDALPSRIRTDAPA